ncbi:hypothetical protein Dimus_005580 [Dionaea muscipula]
MDRVAHPRLMWSYDSAKHRELRVRAVVERTMREGMGLEKGDLRSDLTDFADVVILCENLMPIESLEPDLEASVEGLSSTMAMAIPDESTDVLHARGCEKPIGPTVDSDVLSDGDGSVIFDGEPEMRVVVELQDLSVGPLPSPYSPVSAPSPSRFIDSADRGCEAEERAVVSDGGLSSPCLAGLDSTAMCVSDTEVAGDADAVGDKLC